MMHTSQDAKDKEINILQKGLLFWGGQTRVQLYSHGNSQASTCTPFWFITGSLMLPCPVQCWDFGAAKSLYCPGLHEQVAYPLAYNYKMVYGLLFINLIIALPM